MTGPGAWQIAGIASFDDDAATTYDALLSQTEAALRRAKQAGGNRVDVAGSLGTGRRASAG